jgi:hypothetical protein
MRLLDVWDRNGSTSGQTPRYLDDDDDDDDMIMIMIMIMIIIIIIIMTYCSKDRSTVQIYCMEPGMICSQQS